MEIKTDEPDKSGKTDRTPEENRKHTIQVWKGIGLTLVLHTLFFLVAGIEVSFVIGVAQLIYIIPLMILTMKNTGLFQGVIIGAVVTFLVNAACFGFVMFQLSTM